MRWPESLPKPLFWLILAAALALRVWGTGYGLPHLYHQDEPIVVNHAMAYGTGDLNPHFFKLPPLLSYLVFALYGVSYLILKAIHGTTPQTFAFLFFENPSYFYWIARLIFGAFLGAGSVWLLYRLARRVAGETEALGAAFLLAFCYLHVRDSHYVYADVPMIFSLLAAADALVDYSASGKTRAMVRAAFWTGLATGFKYLAAPFAVVAALAAFGTRGKKGFVDAAAALVFSAAVYALTNPYSFLDWRFFVGEIMGQAKAEAAQPFFHHLTYSLFEGFGLVATLAGIGGLLALWREKPKLRLLWACPFLFYLLIAFFSQAYERYAMPIVPFLCLGAAVFAARVGTLTGRRFVAPAFILLLSFSSLEKDFVLARLFTAPDTRTEALRWFEKNVPPGTRVVLDHEFFSPELFPTVPQLEAMKARAMEGPHGQARLKKLTWLQWAATERKTYEVYYLDWPPTTSASPLLATTRLNVEEFDQAKPKYFVRYRYPLEGPFFDSIRDRAVQRAVFSPYRTYDKVMTDDQLANVGLPFLHREMASRVKPGPYLEVYELEAAS